MTQAHASQPTRIIIVDDDPLVLASLRAYFSTADDIEVVAEASHGREAVEILATQDVDLVLSDIHMPEMDGVTLLEHVQKLEHPPVFVAMTGFDTDETMLQTLTGGAAGYIIKSSKPQEIIASVRDAMSGGTSVSPQCLSRLVDYIPNREAAVLRASQKQLRLTDAEERVLSLLCDGLSNAEIAEKTQYAQSTVKKHVSHLIGYFGVNSRLSLVVAAMRTYWNKRPFPTD
ncbi:response regulator transcription factor [Corynebacterium uberis]|uniref:response regulator transcription factor n=1 Tax=Corynebacterium TaxID=1716 RepID=UPI001D0BAA0A|nr:response regulator transcription factor [Corynebacterium uberis]MCZ9310314.1 response regulator transcription factor [Corynebacterium sp. c6VSa_13]UDL73342.1 response regulator transcription factor [Corynebacterium uberis]UDL75780.1 response regulator transcription factor [Corynebacterium uberis]UDL77992.1 response regulator transcription factor [Corynebacterium uberis]UDL80275.1 response regulator transcription factor [Corynebacterium uberis]